MQQQQQQQQQQQMQGSPLPSHRLSTTNGSHTRFTYSAYSSFQRGALDAAEDIITESILESLDSRNSIVDPFRIADFGCSTGPNTFFAVERIISAVQINRQGGGGGSPEFQVFFNDHSDNDFNALFRSLPPPPPAGGYFSAAAPGTFHGRLFPESSIDAAVSSYALQWLSRVPPGVRRRGSAAFNGESVHCTGFDGGVAAEYAAQYAADMEAFMEARAAEVVEGGVLALLLLGLPDGVLLSETTAGMTFDLLGLCLQDMAKEKVISQDIVESFNLPLYYASIGELERIVNRNGCFSIERIEPMTQPIRTARADVGTIVSHLRAAMEGLITEHFGDVILEELFERFAVNLAENFYIHNDKYRKNIYVFLLLKRKEQAVAHKATKQKCASRERAIEGMEQCGETNKLSADEETNTVMLHRSHHSKLLPMNGGDGPFSYAHNSSYQREVVEYARDIISRAIVEKLNITSSPFDPLLNPFRIADFGCSVGPNTFIAVDNIVNALELKYMQAPMQHLPRNHEQLPSQCAQTLLNPPIPEFQVFFNDLRENDFNTLFTSLPPSSRRYFANGVPGTFQLRLFPKSSLHFAHSVNSLHWLSQLPGTIMDRNSAAFNKAHVYCSGNSELVEQAFANQFKKDMEDFMNARAEELLGGGLMIISINTLPNGVTHSETSGGMTFDLLGSCLQEMAIKGQLSLEKVESFNIPVYFPDVEKVEALMEEFTNSFSIEGIERVIEPQKCASSDVQMVALHVRAATEGLLKQHFGDASNYEDDSVFLDELFQRFERRLADNNFVYDITFRKVK